MAFLDGTGLQSVRDKINALYVRWSAVKQTLSSSTSEVPSCKAVNDAISDISAKYNKDAKVIFVPNYIYGSGNPATGQFLVNLCSLYPNMTNTTFFFSIQDNGGGFGIIHIYNTSDVNSNGIPRYSSGILLFADAYWKKFGTREYNYYFLDFQGANP